jgi:hypothetical protein
MRGFREEDPPPRGDHDDEAFEPVVLDKRAECIGQTPLAIEVIRDDGTRLWVPVSVLHDESEVYRCVAGDGDTGKLIVKRWWAVRRGFVC